MRCLSKTEKSVREIKLLPNVIEVLRLMPSLLQADANTYFFRNPEGASDHHTVVAQEKLVSRPSRSRDPTEEVLRHSPHVITNLISTRTQTGTFPEPSSAARSAKT